MWDRLIGILCAIALVWLILPSYWPSPSRGEPIRIDQSHSAQSKQPTGSDPSEAPPEAFPVKVFPAPKSAAQSEREHQESDRKAANEGALVSATEALAWLTLALVLVAVVQVGFFRSQLKTMNKGLVDTGRSTKAARVAAIAAGRSARAATRQAENAEKVFARTERPYIFAYNLSPFFKDKDTREYYVEYSVANFGRVPAIIEDARVSFVTSDKGEPEIPPALDDEHSLTAAPILQAGDRRERLREYLPKDMSIGDGGIYVDPFGEKPVSYTPKLNLKANEQLFFRVVISYRGPFTPNHETGAMWMEWQPGKFAKRGGDRYNYNR